MDIPSIKTEIEAIARVEAGGYKFQAGDTYTKIKGVRVPIDTFKYDLSIPTGEGTGVKLTGGATSYSGYSSPKTIPSIISYSKISSSSSNINSYLKNVISSSSSASRSSVVPSFTSYKPSGRSSTSKISSFIASSLVTPSISKTPSYPPSRPPRRPPYYPPYYGSSYRPPYRPPRFPPFKLIPCLEDISFIALSNLKVSIGTLTPSIFV